MASSEINVKDTLSIMFPNRSSEQITSAILAVQNDPNANINEKFEFMIDILTQEEDNESGCYEDEAAAYSSNNDTFASNFDYLKGFFPDICLQFLTEFYNKRKSTMDIYQIRNELIGVNYPKILRDPSNIFEQLKDILPNADPLYLKEQANVLVNKTKEEFSEFVHNAIEKHEYPTIQNYLLNKKRLDEIAVYTNTNFNIKKYLEEVPNPTEKFLNTNYKSILCNTDITVEDDVNFTLNFLYNHFNFLRKKDINRVMNAFGNDLIKVFYRLDNQPKAFRFPRKAILENYNNESKNIELLQEIAFLEHEKEIRIYFKMQDEQYRTAKQEAELYNLLQTCNCCFETGLLPEECYYCNNYCAFCKECVKKGTEIAIGEGKLQIECLADCGSYFHISILQMVLNKKTFNGLINKLQADEITKANIQGLENCPFCDYAMIPAEGDKIFKCLNIDCMKESCRLCRHESHIPLKCNEIEYDEDVKIRTYIEDKMTEALVRQCPKCNKKFLKESGCNKMTCQCGMTICYVCGVANVNYNHFQSNGGTCPLYTDNLVEFHNRRVLQGAVQAKIDMGVDKNPEKLKFDPTRNA